MHKSVFIILLTVAVLLLSSNIEAKRKRTTRRNPQLRIENEDKTLCNENACDTVSFGLDSLIQISGYEKTLRSRLESLYAANLSDCTTITSLRIKVDYLDMQARQLHSRIVDIACDIPPGERRLLSFSSWDRQFVMYYRLSAPTRTSTQATAYDVRITPIYAIVTVSSK